VKNLKTKDYLGKARLVAASDRSNAFTGFAGSEKKAALIAEPRGKDDRPTENISYAASNLVQPGLTSRGGREQSAPPAMNRNMFPPTPPPENDKPPGPPNTGVNGMTGRASSVRNPANRPPALQRSGTNLTSMSDPMSVSSMERGPPPIMEDPNTMISPRSRMGMMRTASEPRGPAVRRAPTQSRPALYRETTDESMTDLYDMYQSPPASKRPTRRGTSNNLGGSRQQPAYIDEEDEYMSDAYENDDFMQDDGVDFEMVGGARPGGMQARRPSANQISAARRAAEIKKIRVKVHSKAETRYIMIGPAVEYADFESKVREKFGLRRKLKLQMQDDGDMITMGDQDDLDMLIESAKSAARREKQEMGKMDVSREDFPAVSQGDSLTSPLGLDTGSLREGRRLHQCTSDEVFKDEIP
jgi:PB1 domain